MFLKVEMKHNNKILTKRRLNPKRISHWNKFPSRLLNNNRKIILPLLYLKKRRSNNKKFHTRSNFLTTLMKLLKATQIYRIHLVNSSTQANLNSTCKTNQTTMNLPLN